jgi:hypothetical protein
MDIQTKDSRRLTVRNSKKECTSNSLPIKWGTRSQLLSFGRVCKVTVGCRVIKYDPKVLKFKAAFVSKRFYYKDIYMCC